MKGDQFSLFQMKKTRPHQPSIRHSAGKIKRRARPTNVSGRGVPNMAACSEVQGEVTAENLEGQSLELESLLSIFGEEIKIITPEKEFLVSDR